MTRLILIRHGETDWNVEGRWQGQADVELNPRGRRQAARMARDLAGAGITAIYSSDLARARETAEALARVTGLPIHLDSRLREIHQGEWQGLLVDEIQARYSDAFQRRRENPLEVAPPGGETVSHVRERAVQAVQAIVRRHPHGRVAVVSHGFILAVIQVYYLGRPIGDVWDLIQPNDEWREIEVARDGFSG